MKNNYLKGVHHIAIICSNYEKSKDFYTNTLGLSILREVYREQRQSFKLDLALNDEYIIQRHLNVNCLLSGARTIRYRSKRLSRR